MDLFINKVKNNSFEEFLESYPDSKNHVYVSV